MNHVSVCIFCAITYLGLVLLVTYVISICACFVDCSADVEMHHVISISSMLQQTV